VWFIAARVAIATCCCVCFLLFCFACYLQNQFQYILCWHTYI
jgi:hypothetical protein